MGGNDACPKTATLASPAETGPSAAATLPRAA